MRKILIALFVGIFLISLASCQTYEKGREINILIPFEVNGSIASEAAYLNVTITYPNSTILFENVSATNRGNGFFNITITAEQNTIIGDWEWVAFGCDIGRCATGSDIFEVTNTGSKFRDGQGTIALTILIGALGLAFLFLIIGFRLFDSNKSIPIGFFFIVLSIILGIYSLNLGYAFTHDILQHEALTQTSSTIFLVILWLVVGIAIISMILMVFSFIKEMSNVAKKKKFGEDFDPITNTYS